MVKSFKEFLDEDGMGAAAAGSGAAPTTVTTGVAGAGSDSSTVPVSKKNQRKYQMRGGFRTPDFGPGFK